MPTDTNLAAVQAQRQPSSSLPQTEGVSGCLSPETNVSWVLFPIFLPLQAKRETTSIQASDLRSDRRLFYVG